jgi:hypothetical protein
MPDLNSKFGIVVIIDALGARTQSIENSVEYIKSVEKLKQHIQDMYASAKNIIENIEEVEPLNSIKTIFFGDTILFTLEIKDKNKIKNYLFPISYMLNNLIPLAITEKILFRGAFSIGEYIETDDIVLGPAVIDAANWYEKINIIAIIATPQARNYLMSNEGGWLASITNLSPMFIEYVVANKCTKNLNTLVLNWPSIVKTDELLKTKTQSSVEAWFYNHIKLFFIPPDDNEKYSNTEAFFMEMIK